MINKIQVGILSPPVTLKKKNKLRGWYLESLLPLVFF
jgi:hypothetical protein